MPGKHLELIGPVPRQKKLNLPVAIANVLVLAKRIGGTYSLAFRQDGIIRPQDHLYFLQPLPGGESVQYLSVAGGSTTTTVFRSATGMIFQGLQLLGPRFSHLDHFNLEMQTLSGQRVVQVGYHQIIAH